MSKPRLVLFVSSGLLAIVFAACGGSKASIPSVAPVVAPFPETEDDDGKAAPTAKTGADPADKSDKDDGDGDDDDKPAGGAKPAGSAKPTDAKPASSAKPADAKPAGSAKPADAPKPAAKPGK